MHDTSINHSQMRIAFGYRPCVGSPSVDGSFYIPQRWAEELGRRCNEWLDWRAGLRDVPKWHKLAKMQENGARAWKDVPNATQWVEDLRGNTND